jgi:hypothetical protein
MAGERGKLIPYFLSVRKYMIAVEPLLMAKERFLNQAKPFDAFAWYCFFLLAQLAG